MILEKIQKNVAQKSWNITFLAFYISLSDAEQLVDPIYEKKSILKNLDISRFVKVRQNYRGEYEIIL